MEFDVVLSLVVYFIVVVMLFSYLKLEKKVKTLLEDRKFSPREAVLMVLLMGIMVTIVAFVPSLAIQVLFIIVYSYVMVTFAYLILKNWVLAVIPPFVFILSYLLYPNIFILNLFAIVFAVIISVYLGVLFSWRTTLLFAVLLTVMDIIQVFATGYMIQAAEKMIGLQLPVAIVLPTYPAGRGIALGLGDLFLSGLFAIQTSLKYGKRAGVVVAATIGFAIFVFEVMLFNNVFGGIRGFPATIVVILGWLVGMGIIMIYRLSRSGRASKL